MTARLISSIHVQGLFGLYNYSIPNSGEMTNATILYGDNGVGKSTILRLAFHLLSAAHNRGHRTALYESEFKSLEVSLSSGIRLSARALQIRTVKILILEVFEGTKRLVAWEYLPRSHERIFEENGAYLEIDATGKVIQRRSTTARRKDTLEHLHGEQAYIEVLSRLVPTLFILNADRRLDSDSVADPSDEVELRRTMQYGEPKKINELVARSREIALSQALNAASRWISRKAVIGANQGSTNVHSVYGDVLKRLLSPSSKIPTAVAPGAAIQDLLNQLALIDSKSAEHARYELATHLSTNDFRKALSGRSTKKTELAAELLKPYIKSVEGRLQAVEPIYKLIDRFVSILNGLLRDKCISFKLSQGFFIQNRLGNPLSPAQLSSGEQQLLLLFCSGYTNDIHD
jgi:energy-coupling factor transporter ATP-binding protein EcfA2